MIVITEDSASERLFTASSVTAMEFEISPTAALNAASSTFAIIPIMLVLTIIFSLSYARAAMLAFSLFISGSFNCDPSLPVNDYSAA